jgi:hypothetical protein
MTSDERADAFGRVMVEREQWRVQLWLGDKLIEEHVGPPELAEQYANVLRLRIARLPGRRVHCERVSDNDLTYSRHRPYDPRD